jgi:hypothetical protein
MGAYLTWAGRILGGLLAALCLLFMFGEGNALKLTPWHLSLDVAIAGLILGLFKPLSGGIVTLVGIGAFYALNYGESGKWPGGWVFPVFWLAGALLVLGRVVNRPNAQHD